MLGDTAVAVHPDDPRYQHLIGKMVTIPLVGRDIPIIADRHAGRSEARHRCVKVTPAHDPNDYACGQRHKLPMINILNPDGTINDNGGPYAGLDRYKARERVVEEMEKLGFFEGREDRDIELKHSDRSKTPIEPYLSDQWFVKMDDSWRQPAMDAVTRWPGEVLPGALRQDLPRLARREARLVHQPAAVVGPSHSDLVRDRCPEAELQEAPSPDRD